MKGEVKVFSAFRGVYEVSERVDGVIDAVGVVCNRFVVMKLENAEDCREIPAPSQQGESTAKERRNATN